MGHMAWRAAKVHGVPASCNHVAWPWGMAEGMQGAWCVAHREGVAGRHEGHAPLCSHMLQLEGTAHTPCASFPHCNLWTQLAGAPCTGRCGMAHSCTAGHGA